VEGIWKEKEKVVQDPGIVIIHVQLDPMEHGRAVTEDLENVQKVE
jgi:hypothetical protein